MQLIKKLEARFHANMELHPHTTWDEVEQYINKHPAILASLQVMEDDGGEPDIVDLNHDLLTFVDTCTESPKTRRSFCYDHSALLKRKDNKPLNDAVTAAEKIGARLLKQKEYLALQKYRHFDMKSSTWLLTSPLIREKGGAIYGESRYGEVFIGANGADSYFSSRGVRFILFLE